MTISTIQMLLYKRDFETKCPKVAAALCGRQHPNYKYTAEADKKKNAFSLDRLINRRRRPGLNEACEVYEATVTDEVLTDEDEDILNYDDLDDPDAFV